METIIFRYWIFDMLIREYITFLAISHKFDMFFSSYDVDLEFFFKICSVSTFQCQRERANETNNVQSEEFHVGSSKSEQLLLGADGWGDI